MSSTIRARSKPTVAVVLSGIAAFTIGLVALASSTPGPHAYAQGDCGQPSSDGCPMALDSTVQAAITDAGASHKWLLNVSDTANFVVTLKNLPADYRFSVFGPDSALLGEGNFEGTADKAVQVTNQGVGAYSITIAPNGNSSETPYTLIAANIMMTTAVPLSSYDAPTRFSSYR